MLELEQPNHMPGIAMAELAFHKKRRGVIWTSLTKLGTKLTKLEAEPKSPALMENARSLADKLKTLKQKFKDHQLAIIDRTDNEEGLAEEQKSSIMMTLSLNSVYVFSVYYCLPRLPHHQKPSV